MSNVRWPTCASARLACLALVLAASPLALAQDGPSRDDVADFVASLRADLLTCGRGWHGSLALRIELAADGRVTDVAVIDEGGAPDHVVGCVVSTVRAGRARPFEATSATVEHSIRL